MNKNKAWVTFVVDQTTALEAIVLAKSLSRVVTAADTIVFTTHDIPDSIRQTLTRYYTAVILIHAPSDFNGGQKFANEDFLKLATWNLGMYSKCVLLSSKTLILKNCDELFEMEEDLSAVAHGSPDSFNFAVLTITPNVNVYQMLTRLVHSGKFHNLTELMNYYQKSSSNISTIFPLPGIYNFNILWNNELPLDEAKIVTFENVDLLTDKDTETFTKENKRVIGLMWRSLYDDLQAESDSSLPATMPYEFQNDSISHRENYYKDAIAIVGYSCRFPGANNSNEFWELIKNGGDAICTIPSERLFDFQRDDLRFTESKAGFLKCPIDEFDAKFFGISPREASYMDPQQRLLVEVAWEALEDAAINPISLKGSNTGVYSGVWTHDYERLITENTSGQDFHHVILGNAFSATSARVSYFLGLNGPNVATESGCSSSMVALHLACNSLRNNETNLGLVLGANVMILQFPLSEIPILARDGHCKTYDEKADGFARAEGVAVIVLKRLPDAITNGDRIMGLIRGSALSNEGTTSSFGTPSRHCQEMAIKDALKCAKVSPFEVDYVEAHGTGTPVGDPIEFAAISAGYEGNRENPLLVGSVKTNIGHTESAAGLAGVIKVLLAMKHDMIPPHINLDSINPSIDLSALPAKIPTELTPWVGNRNRKRIAGVSSFGISGTNVHAIIEEPPHFHQKSSKLNLLKCDRSHYILNLSAKSENALKDLASDYVGFFKQNPQLDIGDVTFTANTGRAHFRHRLSTIGRNLEELNSGLETNDTFNSIQCDRPKIGFLFTGQGSQYFGMAKTLYESNLVFRMTFQNCCKIVETNLGIHLTDILWDESQTHLLEQTIYSQLSIFSVEYSLVKVWESLGVKAEFVLGHSVGEFAAATAAGIMDLNSALKLLALRSQLIQNLPSGGMLAVHSSEEKVSGLISEFLKGSHNAWIDIAVINSLHEVVVAGNKDTLESFQTFCKSKDIKCQMLAASHAFHSRAMDAMLKDFGKLNISFNSSNCCYISGTTGEYLSVDEMNISYWQKHAREPVNFPKAVKMLADYGCNCFIEIGAHPVLLALGMTNLPNLDSAIWIPSLRRKEDNWKTLLNSLASLYTYGFNVDWKALDKSISRKKLQLVNYPFQRQKYWIEFKSEGLTRPLHPLLGRKIVLANIRDTIYEHTWNLRDLSYLKDHQVGHTIILPGAGFLEIILAAGRESLIKDKCLSNPIVHVEDFVVECPLELEEDKKYKVQVVVSPVEEDLSKFHVKIYMYQKLNGYNDEKGWKQHSSAFLKHSENNYVVLENNNKEKANEVHSEMIDTIKSRCTKENGAKEFYKLAPEIGICFGETFQSIETVWEGNNEVLAKIPLPKQAGNISDYIFHPIVLDAMIQTFGLSLGKQNADLYLPIGIDKFSMLDYQSLSQCTHLYAHAKWENGKSQGTVSLYRSDDVLIGVMKGLRLLRTSLGSFLNVINSQKNMLPGMYHEVWRVRDGPMQSRVQLSKLTKVILEPLNEIMDKIIDPSLVKVKLPLDFIVGLNFIELFLENGWCPKVGHSIDSETLMQSLLFSYTHLNMLERMLEILCEDGYLVEIQDQVNNGRNWKVIREFPSLSEISQQLHISYDKVLSSNGDQKHPIAEVVYKCKRHMLDVLQGKSTAVSALFGTEGLDPLEVYTKSPEVRQANMCMGHYLDIALKDFKTSGAIVRIIEIGGGSAATSKQIITILQKASIPFRYTFTDISSHFLEPARQQFASVSGVDYKVLDIEKDPSTQGYCPGHYDIVVAANVIHATENLRNAVNNIRILLAPHGMLLLQEILTPTRPIDYIFGILDGYWKFKDYDLRKSHPMVGKPVWDQVFLENGFEISTCISHKGAFTSVLAAKAGALPHIPRIIDEIISKESAWLIFPDRGTNSAALIEKLSITTKVIQIKNRNDGLLMQDGQVSICLANFHQVKDAMNKLLNDYNISGVIYLCCGDSDRVQVEGMYLEMLNICKYFANMNINSKVELFFVTRGVQNVANQANVCPNNAPIWGMVKSLANEATSIFGKLIDLDPDLIDTACESKEIFFELFDKEESIVSFRSRKRYVIRFVSVPKPTASLILPQGRYTIEIPKSKKINDISFRSTRKAILKPNDVEILVKAFALNFRDVFVILKPELYTTLYEAIGTDFSGLVSAVGNEVTDFKVGDEVFGISNSSSAASHVVVPANMLLPKPKMFTFCEASTIPSVFLTAYHCLVTVADLKKDETILIHVASGGVGLIAIQIANFLGAKVIGTAGSHRKRSYLRSIGVEHVFHSRDLSFGENIHKVTSGRGVDVVLNSLTGQGFKETTLGACAEKARFIEMGKVNTWKNKDIQDRRPDVQYTIVDLEKANESEMKVMVRTMKELIRDELFVPLPYSRFEGACIKDAFNYFLKAQHLGKVVVAMPEVKEMGGNQFHSDLVFHSNAAYLITGGLGGIGLEVAKWMVDCGAKNIALIGRTLPNEQALQVLKRLREKGCNVLSLQVDVGNLEQCENLFAVIKSQLPPLRGVIHSAGTISDAIYANQTIEKYNAVFNAKINGGWNMHNLTKDMNLEHFVLFSSMAGIFGPIGQSNHAAANMFLDSLAHYRHSIGLPAQTVNWGAWAQVGAATNTVYGKEGALGVKPFTPNQGIAALKFVMTHPNLVQLGVIQLDAQQIKLNFGQRGNVLSELEDESSSSTSTSSTVQSEAFWNEIKPLNLDERVANIKFRLEVIIRRTLKLPASEPLDEYQTFSEMGLDSLMAVEMRNKLVNMIGNKVTLNASSFLDFPTINGLSKHLAEITILIDSNTTEAETKATEDSDLAVVFDLVSKDSILPDSVQIKDILPAVPVSKIQNVLLTGATGRLGTYVLKDLMQNYNYSIFCLVRGKTKENAKKKLAAALKKFNVFSQVDISKVTIVVGNVADEHLGIPDKDYKDLSKKIDCIIHLAAKANHIENLRQYRILKGNNNDLRSVNVIGTLNVIKFASHVKTKRIIFTSTFATVNRLTTQGFASEDFPDDDNYGDGITMGYALSKFVSEKLLKEANSRGIPSTVIRYPTIVGDSRTGHFTVDTDTFLNFIMISVRLGIIPDVEGGWYTLPVDVASNLTLDLTFNDNARGVFNMLQTTPIRTKDCITTAVKMGYKMEIVPQKDFSVRFQQESENSSWISLFTEAYGSDFINTLFSSTVMSGLSVKNRQTIYQISEKFSNVVPNVQSKIPVIQDILHLYIDFANKTGISEKFGISYNPQSVT